MTQIEKKKDQTTTKQTSRIYPIWPPTSYIYNHYPTRLPRHAISTNSLLFYNRFLLLFSPGRKKKRHSPPSSSLTQLANLPTIASCPSVDQCWRLRLRTGPSRSLQRQRKLEIVAIFFLPIPIYQFTSSKFDHVLQPVYLWWYKVE